MKKLLLILILLVTFGVNAQTKQFRRIYNHIVLVMDGVAGDWLDAENVLIYNYEGKGNVKFYFADNSVETYVKVSDFENDATDSGFTYQGALYLNEKGNAVYIQLFDLEENGVRFIYESGNSIQLAP